jgi:hypothetical protein
LAIGIVRRFEKMRRKRKKTGASKVAASKHQKKSN